MPSLSSRLQQLRLTCSKSVQTVAHACDVSRQAVYKWENGQSIPDITHLTKLITVLDTTVEYIVMGTSNIAIPNHSTITEELRIKLDNVHNILGIKRCISSFLNKYGLDKFFYMQKFRGDISEKPYVITITDLSASWTKNYSKKEYATVDPTWEHSFNNVLPIYSNELFDKYCSNDCSITNEFRNNLEKYVPFFVLIPIHGGCCLGTLVVSVSENTEKYRKKLMEHIDSLTLVGHYIYAATHKIQDKHPKTILTAKEIATIALLANGESIDYIAEQLFISKAAVNARIERAKIKLHARNREQLVLFAASRNILPHNIDKMQTINSPYNTY